VFIQQIKWLNTVDIWKFTAINLNRPDEPVAGSIPVAAALERVGGPRKTAPFPVKKAI
jgi:hypothetical protein